MFGMFIMCLVGILRAAPVEQVIIRHADGGTLDQESVLAFISVKSGDEFAARDVAQDVRRLKDSTRFSYVTAEVQKLTASVNVIYVVRPKLRLVNLRVEGADYFSNKKVKEQMELNVGDLIDENDLAVMIQKVQQEYQERYYPFTRIEYIFDDSPQAGTVKVTIKVVEGTKAKVKSIGFTGNTAISARKLKKTMQQKTTTIFSWFSGSGTYDRDELHRDLLAVRDAFREEGYLDAEVLTPVVDDDGQAIRVTIPVVQHEQYKVKTVRTEGAKLFATATLVREIKLKPGDVASSLAIDNARQAIRDYYGSRGYIRTSVKEKIIGNADHTADIYFTVVEGHLAKIRNIGVRGNTRTKDKVIRRELTVYPGDIFNEVKVRTSAARVRNLGYFSFVNPVTEDTPKNDEFDLIFDVDEQKTGQFIAGAGFSSVDDLIGFIELSQGNFDIKGAPSFMGAGQKLKLRLQLGTRRNDVNLDFVEPWFLDRKLSLGLSAFRTERSFLSDEFDQRNTGASVSLGKSLGKIWRSKVQYSLESIDIYNLSENATDLIKAEAGNNLESAVSLIFSRDSRDHPFIPNRGNSTRLTGKVAGGPLGFDTDLYSLEVRTSQYVPLWAEHVFNVRGWVSTVQEYGDSDRVPIYERLFLGGARTIRGFDFREVGPVDENNEAIGGKSSWYLTSEYTIPLVERFRLASFYDMGMVTADSYDWELGDFNSSAGFGLRIDMPNFPLRLDYSWPLEASEVNDRNSGRFSFLIGHVY
jgi:outer membrane protein insertion porin family